MDILQVFEQMTAVLRDTAPMLKSYYDNLVASGFSNEEAFELICIVQEKLMGGGM